MSVHASLLEQTARNSSLPLIEVDGQYKYIPLAEAVSQLGLGLPVDELRAACDRQENPLPCYRTGRKGGKRLVRKQALVEWLLEEERR